MAAFKTVLAIDTAMNGCHAGVFDSGRGLSLKRSELMERGQSERLIPLVSDLMQEAGREFKELDALICTVGPGTFTGLRIGLSAAQSLALALDIPLFGMTTLQALALQYARDHQGGDFGVIIETKREDFYFQKFSGQGAPLNEAAALPGAQIKAEILIGDALARFERETGTKADLRSKYDVIDAAFLAQLLAEKGAAVFHQPAVPVYLRPADVSQPKKAPRRLKS